MRYMLMFYETRADFDQRTDPAKGPAYWGAWMSYVQALEGSGLVLSGAGLQPPETGTTLRLRDGRRDVQDGPIADTKEQLAGYFLLEAPDLDAVIDWAARAPSTATGRTEIRPVLPPPPAPAP